MRRTSLTTVTTALCLVALVACGGKKRPPAVTTAPTTTAATPAPVATPVPDFDPVGTGPDFQPIDDGSFSATEWEPTSPDGQGPLADVHFGYDQAALSDEARSTLEKHALWLQNHRDAKVVVEGHCDERGTVEYNLALGEQRARAAHDYLRSLGVAEDRMKIVSFGKEKPLDPGHNEAAWARNRRAHFVVTR